MNFQLLRVKRRADQDPASSLYLPVEADKKRTRTESDKSKEFRLFKMVERGNSQPIRIIKPTERDTSSPSSKVILLSDSLETLTVAEAILVNDNDKFEKSEISKLIKTEISDCFDSFNIKDDAMNGEFVYDIYRLDLGRFTSKDIEGKANCVQIVTYEQEFLSEEEGFESETFEDDEDSNAEEYYANDYPDEESCGNDEYDDDDEEFDDNFFFDKTIEIEDGDEDDEEEEEDDDKDFEDDCFAFDENDDLDADDYNCYEDSDDD